MQKNDDRKNKSFIISAVRGVIAGLAVILVIFAITAAFIASGKIPESAMKVIVWSAAFAGALAGAAAAVKSYGSRALVMGMTVSAAVFVLTVIGAAFSEKGAVFGSVTPGLIAALLLGGVLGSYLCTRKKGRKRG